MIDNGTKVTTKEGKDGKDGVVLTKRKVPRSSPIAWEYKVEYPDGKFDWVKRYDVKPVKT